VAEGRSAGIVLAAGASARMGEPKQLLTVRGRPLLELVVAQACASRLDEVVVVLGANADVIRAGIDLGRARAVVNPDHAQGMSTSLKAGVHPLHAEVGRAVVILGDQPDVDAATIDRLLDAQSGSGLPAAALRIGDVLHAPAPSWSPSSTPPAPGITRWTSTPGRTTSACSRAAAADRRRAPAPTIPPKPCPSSTPAPTADGRCRSTGWPR